MSVNASFVAVDQMHLIPEAGKGLDYIGYVVRAYIADNKPKWGRDISGIRFVVISGQILAGLGGFADSVMYKVAIIRKLEWLAIRDEVTNYLIHLKPNLGESATRLSSFFMEYGMSSWVDSVEMRKGVDQLIKDRGWPRSWPNAA